MDKVELSRPGKTLHLDSVFEGRTENKEQNFGEGG